MGLRPNPAGRSGLFADDRSRPAAGPEAPGDDPLGMDADQRRRQWDRLGPPADLHRPRSPRVDALDVIDDDRSAAGASDVAELLRPLQVGPADVDRVAGRVVYPPDRDDVRSAVGTDRGKPTELPSAAQVLELFLG